MEELTAGTSDEDGGNDILAKIQGNIERLVEVRNRIGETLMKQQMEIKELCEQKKEVLDRLNRLK